MTFATSRGALAATLILGLALPARAQEPPPALSEAEAARIIRFIDEHKLKTPKGLIEDMKRRPLDYFRKEYQDELADVRKLMAEDLKKRLDAARAVVAKYKDVTDADLTAEQRHDLSRARIALADLGARDEAVKARNDRMRQMLGIWEVRFIHRGPDRLPRRGMRLVVLDSCIVEFGDAAGEVEGVSGYRLMEDRKDLTEIDISPSRIFPGRGPLLYGLVLAGPKEMRLAYARSADPDRPDRSRPLGLRSVDRPDDVLFELARLEKIAVRVGRAKEKKELAYDDLRRALADIDHITGTWESADGKVRFTARCGEMETVEGKRTVTADFFLNPLTEPKTIRAPYWLQSAVHRGPVEGPMTYELDGDTLTLRVTPRKKKTGGGTSGGDPFDRKKENPFDPKPAKGEPKKDEVKKDDAVSLTLKRVVEKK